MRSLTFIGAAALITAMLGLSGCGTVTVQEEYSFGEMTMHAGNTQVLLFSPFELGQAKIQGSDSTVYGNQDQHLQITATYEQAAGLTLDGAVDKAVAELSRLAEVSLTGRNVGQTTVHGGPALTGDIEYILSAKGQKIPVVERLLVFENQGYIWTVRYTYRQDDETGKAVTDFVFEKLQ